MEWVTRGQGPSDNFLADSTTYDVASFLCFLLGLYNSILATYSASCLLTASSLILFLVILAVVVLSTRSELRRKDTALLWVDEEDFLARYLALFLLGHWRLSL